MSSISKFLKILRVERGENAKVMADKLKISPSYLSAMENGKRTMPIAVQEDIVSLYELSDTKAAKFKQAIEESSTDIKIDFSKIKDEERRSKIKKIVFTLAKEHVSDDCLENMYDLLV